MTDTTSEAQGEELFELISIRVLDPHELSTAFTNEESHNATGWISHVHVFLYAPDGITAYTASFLNDWDAFFQLIFNSWRAFIRLVGWKEDEDNFSIMKRVSPYQIRRKMDAHYMFETRVRDHWDILMEIRRVK